MQIRARRFLSGHDRAAAQGWAVHGDGLAGGEFDAVAVFDEELG